MLGRKKKVAPIPRVVVEDEIQKEPEEGYEIQGEDESPPMEQEDGVEMELPPLPKRTRKQVARARPQAQPTEVEDQPQEEQDSTNTQFSEYLDVIEGNLKRAYLALDELRKNFKV